MSYLKSEQTKKNKPIKDLTKQEKIKYFTWIKQNKTCIVCNGYPEIHHLTNKSIIGPRRLHSRVIGLCFNHHSAQSEYLSLHGNSNKFYQEHFNLEELLYRSEEMYKEYLDETT